MENIRVKKLYRERWMNTDFFSMQHNFGSFMRGIPQNGPPSSLTLATTSLSLADSDGSCRVRYWSNRNQLKKRGKSPLTPKPIPQSITLLCSDSCTLCVNYKSKDLIAMPEETQTIVHYTQLLRMVTWKWLSS